MSRPLQLPELVADEGQSNPEPEKKIDWLFVLKEHWNDSRARFHILTIVPIAPIAIAVSWLGSTAPIAAGWLLAIALLVFALYETLRDEGRLYDFMYWANPLRKWPKWLRKRKNNYLDNHEESSWFDWVCWMAQFFPFGWTAAVTDNAEVLTRAEEKGSRTASTDLVMSLAIAFTVLTFSAPFMIFNYIAVASLLVGFSDPPGRIVGKNYYKFGMKWFDGEKSLGGSCAIFCSAVVVGSLSMPFLTPFGLHLFWVVPLVAIATTLIELIPRRVFDTPVGKLATPADNLWMIVMVCSTLGALHNVVV